MSQTSMFLISILFCITVKATNIDSQSCQIEDFETLFSETFQLIDVSERIAQQKATIESAMPYTQRMYISQDPQLFILFGTLSKNVDFSLVNHNELIEIQKETTKHSELTKDGVLTVLKNLPTTLMITSKLNQGNETLTNIRTMITPNNHCVIGINTIITEENWSDQLKEYLTHKTAIFQNELLKLYGPRKFYRNNEFVMHLNYLDAFQEDMNLAAFLELLADDISVKIRSCDQSESFFDKKLFEKYYTLLKGNVTHFSIDRKIIKTENCDDGINCTIHSIVNGKVVAFNGDLSTEDTSYEVSKIEKINNQLLLKSVEAETLCD